MIYINHSKQAIFIHIPKTGGTYIGPTLVKYYGFTSYLHLITRRRPDHAAICEYNSVKTGIPLYDNTFFNTTIGLLMYCKTSPYLSRYMNMTEEKWNTYTKFCFIRNPYSRALSGWTHFNKVFQLNVDFYEYLLQHNHMSDIEYGHIFMNQTTQIQNELGECGVDIIGRFEHLEEDFRNILLYSLGFPKILHPIKKVNVSNESGLHDLALEGKTVCKLNQLFANDFNAFHYKQYR